MGCLTTYQWHHPLVDVECSIELSIDTAIDTIHVCDTTF